MAVSDCSESLVVMENHFANSNNDLSSVPVLPTYQSISNTDSFKVSGNTNVDSEPCERRKKTRRGKPKRKNPYSKDGNEERKVGTLSKNRPRFSHRHADAPYNTNEFLMEDHNTFVKLSSPPSVPQHIGNSRPPRIRDPSFTSVDSDDDYFYSSPEDEEEFLTKEFSNTYQDLHVETLQGMSKPELVQQVLQLEEKVDSLEKRLGNRSKADREQTDKVKQITDNELEDKSSYDKINLFQQEISRLRLENEKLSIENEKLKRYTQRSSVSSVDSESDSTSSSPSSVSDLSDKGDILTNSSTSEHYIDEINKKESPTGELNQIVVAHEEKEIVL